MLIGKIRLMLSVLSSVHTK